MRCRRRHTPDCLKRGGVQVCVVQSESGPHGEEQFEYFAWGQHHGWAAWRQASPRAWTPGGMAIWRHAGHETPRPLELAAFQPSRHDRQ